MLTRIIQSCTDLLYVENGLRLILQTMKNKKAAEQMLINTRLGFFYVEKEGITEWLLKPELCDFV